ncbi:MAG: DUF4337 family protein [Phycisphaerae bacterium]
MHDPTEHVQEHVQHTAVHGEHHEEHGHGHGPGWINAAALTAAILAAMAAISGALSNGHLTESTHKRIDSNDQWSYYQSKSIKSAIIDTQMYEASLAHQPPPKKAQAKKEEYEGELPEIQKRANALVTISDQHVKMHETYETAEMLFHIAIAIVAIAVVAKRRSFWYLSMIGGAVGGFYFARAAALPVNSEPPEPTEAKAPAVPGKAASAPAEHGNQEAAAEHEHAPASEPAH